MLIQLCAPCWFSYVHHVDSVMCIMLIQLCVSCWFSYVYYVDSVMCTMLIQLCASCWFSYVYHVDSVMCIMLIQLCASCWFSYVHHVYSVMCIMLIQLCASCWFSYVHVDSVMCIMLIQLCACWFSYVHHVDSVMCIMSNYLKPEHVMHQLHNNQVIDIIINSKFIPQVSDCAARNLTCMSNEADTTFWQYQYSDYACTAQWVLIYLVAYLFWKISLLNIEKHAKFVRICIIWYIWFPTSKSAYYYIQNTYSWIISGAEMHVIFCANLACKLIKK